MSYIKPSNQFKLYNPISNPANTGLRRSFTNVQSLNTFNQGVANFITFDINNWDVSNLLNNSQEFGQQCAVYKYLKINALRVNVIQFNTNIPSSTISFMPLVLYYDGNTDTNAIQVATQNLAIPLTGLQNLVPYQQILQLSKSKIIANSPDTFQCSVVSSVGALRQSITVVSGIGTIPPNTFGWLKLLAAFANLVPQYQQYATLQIIIDVSMFDL